MESKLFVCVSETEQKATVLTKKVNKDDGLHLCTVLQSASQTSSFSCTSLNSLYQNLPLFVHAASIPVYYTLNAITINYQIALIPLLYSSTRPFNHAHFSIFVVDVACSRLRIYQHAANYQINMNKTLLGNDLLQ